jgi:hypothetical protein
VGVLGAIGVALVLAGAGVLGLAGAVAAGVLLVVAEFVEEPEFAENTR